MDSTLPHLKDPRERIIGLLMDSRSRAVDFSLAVSWVLVQPQGSLLSMPSYECTDWRAARWSSSRQRILSPHVSGIT
jgi:hypothetical protein